jgi:hypothetical protein
VAAVLDMAVVFLFRVSWELEVEEQFLIKKSLSLFCFFKKFSSVYWN